MAAYRRSIESGISYERIYDYLAKELALEPTEAGCFRYGDCLILLKQLPSRSLGVFTLPRNELLLEGRQQDAENFIDGFMIRFLSVGG